MDGGDSSASPLEAAAGAAGSQVIKAFKLLGNESRLAIMLALWEARSPRGGDDTVTFSELYERVAVRDSGQFSYHLDKLVPHFVEKTEDGYELTESGFSVVQAVIAGTGFTNPPFEPVTIDKACPRCEHPMRMDYEEHMAFYYCVNCEGAWGSDETAGKPEGYIGGGVFPPAGLEGRTPDEIAEAFNAYSVVQGLAMLFEVCPDCGGTIETTITVCEDHDQSDDVCPNCGRLNLGRFEFECTVCKFSFGTALWVLMVLHPASVAFFYDHDIDYLTDIWRMIRIGFAGTVELASSDPLRLGLSLTVDDDELRMTIDERLRVVELTER